MRSGNRAVTGTTRVGPSGSATGFGSAGSSGNGAGSPGRFGGGAIFRTPDERFFVGLVVWPSRLREAGGKPAPWFALAYSFGFAACFGDGFFGAVNWAESAACARWSAAGLRCADICWTACGWRGFWDCAAQA